MWWPVAWVGVGVGVGVGGWGVRQALSAWTGKGGWAGPGGGGEMCRPATHMHMHKITCASCARLYIYVVG